MTELDLHIGESAQPLQQKLRGLELFALHHEGMARIVLEDGMVELGDELAARPVPELEDRRDQADARHVISESAVLEQIKRRRMGGGGARIGPQFAVVVEHRDRQTPPP